jgi:hypothetical protein
MELKRYGSPIIENVPDITTYNDLQQSRTYMRTTAAKYPRWPIRTRSLPPSVLPPSFRLLQFPDTQSHRGAPWSRSSGQVGSITAQRTPYRNLRRIGLPVPRNATRIRPLIVVFAPTCFVTEERVEVRMTEVIWNPVSVSVAYGRSGIFVWTPSDVAPHAARAACNAFVPSSSEIIHLTRPVLTTKWKQDLPLVKRNPIEIVAPV